jgi:hypothetical protein
MKKFWSPMFWGEKGGVNAEGNALPMIAGAIASSNISASACARSARRTIEQLQWLLRKAYTMPTIKPLIDVGLQVDPANVPAGHIFVVAYHGGYFVDGQMITGVPFVMSYPLSHKTDKHFICDDGDKKKHVDLDPGFESYKDACAKVIAATRDRIEGLRQKSGLLEAMLADREAKKP